MSLINCEINLDVDWPKSCFIVANNANQDTTFSITDTKIYVSVVTKSGFKRTINWNKYQPKILIERQNKS